MTKLSRKIVLHPVARLFLSLELISAALIARNLTTVYAQCLAILLYLLFFESPAQKKQILMLTAPMALLVTAMTWITLDAKTALFLALRFWNLTTVSALCFQRIGAADMATALRKLKTPYPIVFLLTTAMRYIPLIRLRVRHIIEAQKSRGIDLRLRLKNAPHIFALFLPLLVQCLMLSEEMAMAMECRGFSRTGRTIRRRGRLQTMDWLVMAAGLILPLMLFQWEFR
jgi:energy-coupling factor transporter transmembrane protein EcfT